MEVVADVRTSKVSASKNFFRLAPLTTKMEERQQLLVQALKTFSLSAELPWLLDSSSKLLMI